MLLILCLHCSNKLYLSRCVYMVWGCVNILHAYYSACKCRVCTCRSDDCIPFFICNARQVFKSWIGPGAAFAGLGRSKHWTAGWTTQGHPRDRAGEKTSEHHAQTPYKSFGSFYFVSVMIIIMISIVIVVIIIIGFNMVLCGQQFVFVF